MVSPRWYVLCSIPALLFVCMNFYCSYKPSMSMHQSKSYQFDVFFGFRDMKAHFGFTEHLATKLIQAGIGIFRDDRKAGIGIFRDDRSVEPGDNVEYEVRKAITNSGVYIVVISSAHVSPVFLDELVLMVQQRKASDHLLLPIFYHVHHSVVEFRTGPFCRAFLDLNQEFDLARNQRNEAIIQAGDPAGLFSFHLSDDAVATLQEHLLQKASLLKKEMEDISQRLFKWKEALHDVACLKPVQIDENSHESEAVKLIVGRVVKHITTKQSLSSALVRDITMKQNFQSGRHVCKFCFLDFLFFALKISEDQKV